MIKWFQPPYVGQKTDGFDILIHGIVLSADLSGAFAGQNLTVIAVLDDGQLELVPYGEVKMDWRWTREKGWFGTMEQMAEANT